MAQIVFSVFIDDEVEGNDTQALREAMIDMVEAAAGLMHNDTLVNSFILADDERLTVEAVK